MFKIKNFLTEILEKAMSKVPYKIISQIEPKCAEEKDEEHPEEPRGLDTGLIWIIGPIDEDAVERFLSIYHELNAMPEVDKIEVKIISQGGSVSCGIAIAEEIRLSKKKIITIAQGTVASIAVLIFESGHIRHMTKLSEIMMHKPISVLGENEYSSEELGNLRAMNLASEAMMLKVFSEKTGKTPQKIKKDIGAFKTFTAEEALAYGLVDELI